MCNFWCLFLRWLKERQLPDGALQGRPGKKGDTCYAFWVTAALLLLGKQPLEAFRTEAVALAIFAAQHPFGGISREPNRKGKLEKLSKDDGGAACSRDSPFRYFNLGMFDSLSGSAQHPDPFHTFFALAGLSLLAHGTGFSGPSSTAQQGQEGQGYEWQDTCRRLLQQFDVKTALPLNVARKLYRELP